MIGEAHVGAVGKDEVCVCVCGKGGRRAVREVKGA
jgi:hypothetical protein